MTSPPPKLMNPSKFNDVSYNSSFGAKRSSRRQHLLDRPKTVTRHLPLIPEALASHEGRRWCIRSLLKAGQACVWNWPLWKNSSINYRGEQGPRKVVQTLQVSEDFGVDLINKNIKLCELILIQYLPNIEMMKQNYKVTTRN